MRFFLTFNDPLLHYSVYVHYTFVKIQFFSNKFKSMNMHRIIYAIRYTVNLSYMYQPTMYHALHKNLRLLVSPFICCCCCVSVIVIVIDVDCKSTLLLFIILFFMVIHNTYLYNVCMKTQKSSLVVLVG